MPSIAPLADKVLKPEYTGANRCTPCTVANLVIAAAVSGLIAVERPLVGLAVFCSSAVVVALRGYLIPGTPALTERYLPHVFHRREDRDGGLTDRTPGGAIDPERYLLEHGVVEPCDGGDDLRLRTDVARDWRSTAVTIDPDLPATAVAPVAEFDPDSTSVIHGRNGFYLADETRQFQWISRGALVVDAAADSVLRSRIGNWTELPVPHRLGVLRGLRVLLDTCPLCAGTVQIESNTVRSCCSSHDVIAVSCQSCGERFHELDAREL